MSGVDKTQSHDNFPIANTTSEKIVQAFEKYFGPAPYKFKLNGPERNKITNEVLADAYAGQNVVLRDTLTNLIMSGDTQQFYTTYLVPWYFTSEQNFVMNRTIFDVAPAGRTPYEGISRLLTQSSESMEETTERRGIGFVVEDGFYETEKGKRSYAMNLLGIARCVQETVNLTTMNAILSCKNYQSMYQQAFGTLELSIANIVQQEIYKYACISHDNGTRFRIAVERAVSALKKRGSTASAIIITPEAKAFLNDIAGVVQKYSPVLADGSRGPPIDGPKSDTVFQGIPVYIANEMAIGGPGKNVQLLTRDNQVGERYEMFWRDKSCHNNSDYVTQMRDTYIYNQNIDSPEKVKFTTAFRNTFIFDKRGDWKREVLQLVADANSGKFKWKTPDANGSFDSVDVMLEYSEGVEKPFFFATQSDDGTWILANYIGNMDKWALGHYLKQLGECLKGKISSSMVESSESNTVSWYQTDKVAWEELLVLLHSIESQQYNKAFFTELIAKNVANSVGGSKFIGEFAPEDINKLWNNQSSIREWKPNSHGGLDLPAKEGSFAHLKYPIGYGNWPGLLTLADEFDKPNSGWSAAGKQAHKAVSLIRKIVSTLLTYAPHSEALKPQNRSPNFHVPDPCTTFFENVVSVARDPVFLAVLTPKNGGLAKELPSEENAIRSNLNNAVDYISLEEDIASDETVDQFLERLAKNDGWVYTDIDGTPIKTGKGGCVYISNPLRALLLMGQESSKVLLQLYRELGGDKKDLVHFILKYSYANSDMESIKLLRYFIIALMIVEPEEKKKALNLISTNKIKPSLIKSIASQAKGSLDPDLTLAMNKQLQAKLFSPKKLTEDGSINLIRAYDNVYAFWKSLGYTEFNFVALDNEATDKDLKADIALVAGHATDPDLVGLIKGATQRSREATDIGEVPTDLCYYRCPLTMSLELLESLANEVNPLILPSDPETGHNLPLTQKGDIIDDRVWRRPNYARLNAGLRSVEKPHFALGFMQRHLLGHKVPSSDNKRKGDEKGGKFNKKFATLGADFSWDDENSKPTYSKKDLKTKRPKGSQLDSYSRMPFRQGHESIFNIINTRSFIANFKDVNNLADPLVRACAVVGMLCPCRGDVFSEFLDSDVHVPFNIALWRLFIEHQMSSVVVMEAGEVTGFNVYGNSNFALSHDGMSKRMLGHFTFEHKSIIANPENIELIENCKPDGYVGGRNCEFIPEGKLELSQTRERNRPSLMATMLPLSETKLGYIMSFSERLPVPEMNTSIDGPNRYCVSTASYYDRYIWNMSDRTKGTYQFLSGYYDRPNSMNIIALQGLQYNYNSATKLYDSIIECNGHMTGPGSAHGSATVSYFISS
jgi:hypothetical protein